MWRFSSTLYVGEDHRFPPQFDQGPTVRCFLYACYGNPVTGCRASATPPRTSSAPGSPPGSRQPCGLRPTPAARRRRPRPPGAGETCEAEIAAARLAIAVCQARPGVAGAAGRPRCSVLSGQAGAHTHQPLQGHGVEASQGAEHRIPAPCHSCALLAALTFHGLEVQGTILCRKHWGSMPLEPQKRLAVWARLPYYRPAQLVDRHYGAAGAHDCAAPDARGKSPHAVQGPAATRLP